MEIASVKNIVVKLKSHRLNLIDLITVLDYVENANHNLEFTRKTTVELLFSQRSNTVEFQAEMLNDNKDLFKA